MRHGKILIVDDEPSIRQSLAAWLTEDGYTVETAENASRALVSMHGGPYDVILLDIRLPESDGLSLQKEMIRTDPDATIIIMTGYASVETAIEALRLGAFDYLTKPVDPEALSQLIRVALKKKDLNRNGSIHEVKTARSIGADEILFESVEMKRVWDMVQTVSATEAAVLIRGESGTGKELIARAIHRQSKRRFSPIVAVNCGAITESLLESELFGYEKGAFTGAQHRRRGKIELSNRGTLFLDEIGDISQKMQVDLLRVLDTKSLVRVGGTDETRIDFRLVCASNRNLEELVEKGTFREDLYYRINVVSIFIPPLRERRTDILPLAEHFIRKYSRSMGKPRKSIAKDALRFLMDYHWPGNVRELGNAIERAMVIGKGPVIPLSDFPMHRDGSEDPVTRLFPLKEVEKEHIQRILDEVGGNVSRAAELLEVDRVTVYNKMKKYGITR